MTASTKGAKRRAKGLLAVAPAPCRTTADRRTRCPSSAAR